MRDFIDKVYDKLYCFPLLRGCVTHMRRGLARMDFLLYKGGFAPYFFSFLTLPGISFMTLVLQNITSSILTTKTQAKNPRTLTLICCYAISLDPRALR